MPILTRKSPVICAIRAVLLSILLALSAGADPDLVVDCERAPRPILVDADLTEWDDASFIPFGPESGQRQWQRVWLRSDGDADPPGSSGTDADLSGRLSLRWDDDFLYLAAFVVDDVLDTDGTAEHAWYHRDGIALFLDVPRDGDGRGWVTGDHAISFSAAVDPPPHFRWWRRGTPRGHRGSAAPTGVTHAVRLTPNGYQLEARVPMALLAAFAPDFLPPFDEREIGFLFLVTDPDHDAQPFGGQLMFGGSGDDDASWSRLRFVGIGDAAQPRIEPDLEWEAFRDRLDVDLERVGPLFLDDGATAQEDAMQSELGDWYFTQYIEHRPSRLATKALWMAATLWGNAGDVDRLSDAVGQIDGSEDVWEEVVPGLRQAYLRHDRFHDMIDLLEEASTRVVPLKSRSVVLFTLAEYWVGIDEDGRALPVLQDIVNWRASPWHVRRAWELVRQMTGAGPGPLPDIRM